MRAKSLAAVATVAFLASAGVAAATVDPAPAGAPLVVAQGDRPHGTEPRELDPRYKPVPPEPEPWYNTEYLFGITRAITDSTLVPAAQGPLLLLSVPLDIALLPFTAIGGFF